MKKLRLLLLPFFFVTLFFSSCEVEQENFDETLLIGKWVSGTEYYKYNANGTGGTWDTADDVTEEEAQSFTWTLVQSELTHIHMLEIGGSVPKVYIVTKLTATTLEYEGDFGQQFSYSKVD